jgi:hypothetical protein
VFLWTVAMRKPQVYAGRGENRTGCFPTESDIKIVSQPQSVVNGKCVGIT